MSGIQQFSFINRLSFPNYAKRSVEKFGDLPYLHNKGADGKWIPTSFKQFYANMCNLGRAMVATGVTERAGLLVMGYNSVEWVTAFGVCYYRNALYFLYIQAGMLINCVSGGLL